MSTHEAIEAEHRADMNRLAKLIDATLNAGQFAPRVGFCLLVFPLGVPDPASNPRMNYIANANRADMVKAMREFIARAEGTHPEEIDGKPQA